MYYLVYGLLYLLSLLPMRALYIIADGAYLFVYYIMRYRKNIVMKNLAIAFPEKTIEQRIIIAKEFYKNFADNFIESIKLVSASNSFLTKHFIIDNPELINNYYKQGRKCQLHLGHNFNWELANITMPYCVDYQFMVVYMPIENEIFNRIFLKIRSRTGTKLLSAKKLSREIMQYRNSQYMLTLVADQAPAKISSSYWLYFFNQPTPFMQTPEKGARIADIPVLFANLYKTKRGFYRARLEVLSDNPARLPEGELTRRYIYNLEKTLRQHPSMWLWTHRRWKHTWSADNLKLWIDEKEPPQG